MTRRRIIILFAISMVLTLVNCEPMLKFEEENIGRNSPSLNGIMRDMSNNQNKDTANLEGSGDDDEDSNHISGSGEEDSSGGNSYNVEGSGEDDDNQIKNTKTTEKPEGTTDKVVEINGGKTTTKKPSSTKKKKTTKATTTMGNHVEVTADGENPNVAKSVDDNNGGDDDDGGISFTLGIVIGVVVGSILAILIIVLLVYRLRKKDEGSYSLDDQSSTQFIRDPDSPQKGGKEYLA